MHKEGNDMKEKYIKPIAELEAFKSADMLTVSDPEIVTDDNDLIFGQ